MKGLLVKGLLVKGLLVKGLLVKGLLVASVRKVCWGQLLCRWHGDWQCSGRRTIRGWPVC